MSNAISTISQQTLFLQTISQLQTQATTLEQQVSTGVKSQDISGYGGAAAQLTNLQSAISHRQNYVDTINTVQQNIKESTTVLSSIESAVGNFVSGLPTNAFNTTSTIQSQAQQLLQVVGDFLNTKDGNGFIFSGSLGNTAPFDASGLPSPGSLAASVSGAPPNGYYAGNDTAAQAQIDDTLGIKYGVTADNPAIESVVRALNFFATLPAGSPSSSNATDVANVTAAQNLLSQGINGLQSVIGTLASQSAELKQVQQQHQDFINLTQANLTDLESVDPATVITKLNQLETNMQASYTTIGDLQKLSLVNFFR